MSGRGPVFLLGIQRGGTNQVLNILRSHPDTTWPQGEFHEVFRWRGLRREGVGAVLAKTLRYAPVRLGAGDILDPDRRAPREGMLAGRRGRAVAAGLAAATAANRDQVLAYKAGLAAHGLLDGVPRADRMLVKVMNYNLLFAPDLAALYPDAVFVGLIREALAVAEGHVARGAPVEEAAAAWAFAAGQLAELGDRLPLRVWRFEDLVADTPRVAREIYAFAGLDPEAARGVCLQDKERVVDAGGTIRGNRKRDLYYGFEEMGAHMRADANAGARRMDEAAQAAILARCAPELRHVGYPATPADPGSASRGKAVEPNPRRLYGQSASFPLWDGAPWDLPRARPGPARPDPVPGGCPAAGRFPARVLQLSGSRKWFVEQPRCPKPRRTGVPSGVTSPPRPPRKRRVRASPG